MTKTSDEKSSKLKPYQMILLSCLLAAFMIINSNNVNYNRDLAKLNKEKGELFDRIINTRRLSSTSSQTYSAEICARGSDDLKEYYQKGDPKIIDIDPHKSIECEEKDETYMKALINIVRTIADDTEEDSDADTHSGSEPAPDDGSGDGTGGEGTGGRRRNLRNLGGVSDIDQQDLTDYGMRFLPMAVFLVFGILSIFGWIFCCICCCCDCCCCCCLKKTSCKVPCFIFTYVFYGLVVGISLYGLIQSNKIFVSLSDTECSILKFFEQVLNGEIKQSRPRWAGIEGIKGMLTTMSGTVTDLKTRAYNDLNNYMNHDLPDAKDAFDGVMQVIEDRFHDNDGNYKSHYMKPLSGTSKLSLSGNYIYDVVKHFGKYNPADQTYTSGSYLDLWHREYSTVDGEASHNLETAQRAFNDILDGDGFNRVIKALDDGKKNIDKLTGPFTDANVEIGKMFSNVSESIDNYGKLSVKVIFGALMGMNVALAALMLLICMFSGKSCTSCCCCRCLFKFCTHILWNVLALLMILSFIFGSLIALLGRFGGDAMGLVSYIMSIDNFNGTNPLLVDKLDEAKDYIYKCIHGDGNIVDLIGLGNSLSSFNDINNVENDINVAKRNFSQTILSTPAFYHIKGILDKQKNYETEAVMIREDGATTGKEYIGNKELINEYINKELSSGDKKWDLGNPNDYDCAHAPASYYPINCKPIDSSHYNHDSETDFNKYAVIFANIDSAIEHANKEGDGSPTDSVINVITYLKNAYTTYLGIYVDILDFFARTINSITSIVSQYSDPQYAFSFLNGKFIGINLQIVLKYLKHSLGGDFFTVGICLCVVGLSLILSISSTIILIVIINIGLKEAIEQNKLINNPGTAVSPFEGVPNMPKPPY